MIPSKSSTSSGGCLPVSSNCVIWQGPCLDCIELNTGDTISDVVARMATELCKVQTDLGLSTLDLKCLFNATSGSPEPEKKIANIFSLLINKVCSLEQAINEAAQEEEAALDSVTVASCFQTTNLDGDLVTSLSQVDYLRAIGIRVCSVYATVTGHTNTLANHENRINVLEVSAGGPAAALPTVTPECVIPGGTPQPMRDVLEAVEEQFCQLRSVTGSPTDLAQSIGKQCVNLNSAKAISSNTTMSAIPGWKPTVSTVADSLNNLWLTICDMRAAMSGLQLGAKCSDILVDFIVAIVDNGNTARLYFSGYSQIPAGFADCDAQGSVLTISDGVGGVYTMRVNIVASASSAQPVEIDLTATPLLQGGTYSFTLSSCLTDGNLTCNKTIIKNALVSASACTAPTDITATLS